MNIATNPWTFTSTDVPAASTGAASPTGMVQQGASLNDGKALATVLYTALAAHGLVVGQFVTYISDANGRFQGWYKVIAVPSATTALLLNLSSPTSGSGFNTVIAASGGGTMLVNQIQQNVRAEDISIMATSATPGATLLSLLDRNGLIVWQFIGAATTPGFASQNRGKPMWFDGLTLQSIPTGCIVEVTIN